jgi:hypothetical protein
LEQQKKIHSNYLKTKHELEEAEELDESKQKNEQNYENYNNYQSEKKKTIDFTKTVKRNHQFKELGEQNYEITK